MTRLALIAALLVAGCGNDAGNADAAMDLSALTDGGSDLRAASDPGGGCNGTLTGGLDATLTGCMPALVEQNGGTQWWFYLVYDTGTGTTLSVNIFGPGAAPATGTFTFANLDTVYISADEYTDAGSTKWVAQNPSTGSATLTIQQLPSNRDAGVDAQGSLQATLHVAGRPDTQLSLSFAPPGA